MVGPRRTMDMHSKARDRKTSAETARGSFRRAVPGTGSGVGEDSNSSSSMGDGAQVIGATSFFTTACAAEARERGTQRVASKQWPAKQATACSRERRRRRRGEESRDVGRHKCPDAEAATLRGKPHNEKAIGAMRLHIVQLACSMPLNCARCTANILRGTCEPDVATASATSRAAGRSRSFGWPHIHNGRVSRQKISMQAELSIFLWYE